MASADITTKKTRINNVQSYQNIVRSEVFHFNGSDYPGILANDTHSLCVIPAGCAVTSITVIALDTATSAGSATAQFKLKVGTDTAEALGSAIALANLAKGDVHRLNAAALKAYGKAKETTIQLTVGTAAFTALDFLLVVEFLPVDEMLTKG